MGADKADYLTEIFANEQHQTRCLLASIRDILGAELDTAGDGAQGAPNIAGNKGRNFLATLVIHFAEPAARSGTTDTGQFPAGILATAQVSRARHAVHAGVQYRVDVKL